MRPIFIRSLALLASVALSACADNDPPANYPPPPAPSETISADTAETDPPPEDVQIGVDGDQYSDTDPSALTDFRAPLDPYGSWVDDPNYGTIWVPNSDVVGDDFTPYVSGGHWAYDDDWVWVSDYSWGWAPFHYGRWVDVNGRWGWIPGRTYAGAWVVWRTGGDGYGYVGWAPAPPAWAWRHGVAVGIAVAPPAPRFSFVARDDLFSAGLRGHVIVGERARGFEHDTHVYGEPTRVAGHPFAYAPNRGPEPTRMGIAADHVVHAAPPAEGVVHAQQFGRPSTAQSMGGHAATPHTVRVAPPVRPHTGGVRHGGGGHHR